jgi:hypothetical protein
MSFAAKRWRVTGRGWGMLRAAAWTVGLFALAGGVVQIFPGPFTEPLVLLAIGTTMFLVSGRGALATKAEESASGSRSTTATRAAR